MNRITVLLNRIKGPGKQDEMISSVEVKVIPRIGEKLIFKGTAFVVHEIRHLVESIDLPRTSHNITLRLKTDGTPPKEEA